MASNEGSSIGTDDHHLDGQRLKSIDDVCLRVTSGGTPSRRNPSFFEGGTWPWIKTQELLDGWLDGSEEHITDHAVASSSARVLPENTVLMAMYGATVSRLGILRRPMTCNQACCAMIVDPTQADYRYLFYNLLHARQQIKRLSTGAAQQNLSGQLIKSLKFSFPSLVEQRAIAHILGTLDDKIELNRRMNQTLEEMARSLFKSWFVDFDPVRAKAALKRHALRHHTAAAAEPSENGAAPAGEWTVERARSYLAGMDPQVADLFPDRLVDSVQGKIPDGWLIQPLEKAAHTTYGAPFSSRRFNSDGFGTPLIRIRDLATHSPSVFTEETHPKGQIIRPGDIVAGMDGEFRVHIWKGPSSWLNQRLCRFEPLPHVPTVFLFESLIGPLADSERSKVGTTVIHLGKRDIDTFTLLMPTQSILDQFSCLTEPIARRLVANASQTRAIAAQRDALLPQLVNGQLKAYNAARHITGVD